MRNLILALLLVSNISFAGEISGRVSMEKTGKAVGKIPMRMHIYKDEYEFSGAELLTDASGRYAFKNLKEDSNFAYIVYPIYEGVNYPYKTVEFQKEKSVKVDFTITESTGSVENITADESIFFEFGKKDIWKVTHEITLENKGDLLYHYSRADSQPLLFSLFNGGFDLSYLEGVTRGNSKIDDDKDTLHVMMTLAPHQKTFIKFSYYYLPIQRNVAFDREAYISRSNVTLFFKDGIRIASTQFQSDPMMLQGREGFNRAFTSGPVKINEKITFDIKGFFLQGDMLHLVLLAASLAMICAVSLWALKQKKTRNASKQLTDKVERYLIELKKQHQAGAIEESHFKKEEHKVRNFLYEMSKPNQS
ncbi:MAG: hypothetical protein IT286_03780 [Proteobacteria bacterium]|jgi:hypothetical protein|nr:hypothetical protein [Pseudomonadota bacterium]